MLVNNKKYKEKKINKNDKIPPCKKHNLKHFDTTLKLAYHNINNQLTKSQEHD